ncbi:MAG: Ig-like domain-containing protein [Patescibacteria group bacterium]
MLRQNKKLLSFLAVLLFLIGAFVLAFFYFAQISQATTVDDYEQSIQNLKLPGIGVEIKLVQTVVNIINIFLGVLGLIAVILIIYGGFIWMTARGSVEAVLKAKKIIKNTLVGLAVILLSYVIVRAVMNFIIDWAENNINPPVQVCEPFVDTDCSVCKVCKSDGTWPSSANDIGLRCANCRNIDDPDSFNAVEVNTSHVGSNPAVDVRLCSNIQTRFNNAVGHSSFNDMASGGYLKIVKIHNNTEQIISNSNNWGVNGKFISFIQPNLYETNTNYKLYLPNSLADGMGNYLSDCLASPSCVVSGTNFVWSFITGTEVDDQAPNIITTSPVNGDINVPLSPYVKIDFDEEINALSVVPDSIQIFDSQNTRVDTVTAFDVSTSRVSFSFTSDLAEFETYRVVVSGIEDMCNNPMDSLYEFSFTTGNQSSAVSGYYPTGNKVCPDEKIIFNFSVSMEGNIVIFSLFDGAQSKDISLKPGEIEKIISGFGTLKMVNNGFTAYKFEPETLLKTNTNYHAYIDTDKQINQQGGMLTADWTFKTSTQEDCSCEPYISYFAPGQGGPGECITIYGSCFLGRGQYLRTPKQVNFDSQAVAVVAGSFTDNSVVTTAPINLTMNNQQPREVPVSLVTMQNIGGQEVLSNSQNWFVVTNNLSQGPCLYSLSPSSGRAGDTVRARGKRFGTDQGELTFHLNQTAIVANWSETEVSAPVPDLAKSGDVIVKNSLGLYSNPLYFEITNYIPPDEYLSVINDSRCEMSGNSISNYPSPNPYINANQTCNNAIISARFNKLIDATTINSNTVIVRKCQGVDNAEDCNSAVDGNLSTFIYLNSNGGFKFIPNSNLSPDTFYEVTLKSGISSLDGKILQSDYVWSFKTRSSSGNCILERVNVSPYSYYTRVKNIIVDYLAEAFTENCQEIPANYNWVWESSDTNIATVEIQTDKYKAKATVVGNKTGKTNIMASAEGKSDFGILEYNPDECTTDAQCLDYYGDGSYLCTGSVCDDVSRRCVPVIKTLSPDRGSAGRFTTVQGCYFENNKGTGKVEFDFLEAEYPCSVKWNDTEIITKVPTLSADAKVKVTTGHNLISNQVDFIIDPMCGPLIGAADFEAIPGLCSLSPRISRSGSRITLYGEDLIVHSSMDADDNKNKADCAVSDLDCDNQQNMCEQSGFNYTDVGYTINGAPSCCGDDTAEFFIGPTDSHSCDNSQGCCPSVDYYIKDGVCVDDCAVGTPFAHRVFFNNLEATEYGNWETDNIQVNVPANALSGHVAVSIFGCSSNELSFTVAGQSCDSNINTAMCETQQSLCSPGLVCQASTCTCELPAPPEPLLVIDSSRKPGGNESVECLNTVVGATFNQKVKPLTLNSSNIKLDWFRDDGCMCEDPSNMPACALNGHSESKSLLARIWSWFRKIIGVKKIYAAPGLWCPVNGTIQSFLVDKGVSSCNNSNGCTQFSFIPTNILEQGRLYKITIIGSTIGVEAESGGILENGDYSWQFTTSGNAQICKITNVNIVPNSYIFTQTGEEFTFRAQAMSNNEEIFNSAQYPFVWLWSKKEMDENLPIIELAISNINENLVRALNQNGKATLYATASTTDPNLRHDIQVKKTGSTAITNFLCENPVFVYSNRTASNYSTMYCRDGETLLPDAIQQDKDYVGNHELLTEKFILISDNNKDAIGIRVYKNINELSSEEWYKNNAPNPNSSLSHLDIDDYDAVKVDRSIYVTAVNHTDDPVAGSPTANSPFYYNMYIISYNDGAGSNAVEIFDQLIENWQFNNNITDFDKRSALHRDVKRRYNLGDMRLWLEDYYAGNGSYPILAAGSYIQHQSTSMWPSWQQVLGADLSKTMPRDPINVFIDCPIGYDETSCWNNATHDFKCPKGSHIYLYETNAQGTSFNIYANMEYEVWDKDDTCRDYVVNHSN